MVHNHLQMVSKKWKPALIDVHYLHSFGKIEQVVLRISVVIWEMYQRDWENL